MSSLERPRGDRRATVHGCAGRRPASRTASPPWWPETATFDDYVAGRSDRSGSDLILDLRFCRSQDRLPQSVAADTAVDLSAVRRALSRHVVDLVWLWCPRPWSDTEHTRLAAVARLCWYRGIPALMIEDDEEDAAAVGLLPHRPDGPADPERGAPTAPGGHPG